jgi:hypothetical protein
MANVFCIYRKSVRYQIRDDIYFTIFAKQFYPDPISGHGAVRSIGMPFEIPACAYRMEMVMNKRPTSRVRETA